jgi:APA family basic amino acid/polyamine antiporter
VISVAEPGEAINNTACKRRFPLVERVEPPSLEKELKLRNFFTLSVGTIIGVGWITILGAWLRDAGSLGTVFAFMGGGLFMALIGLCYAEVEAMYPVSGGEVAYAYEIFGLRASFASGWFLALSYIATVGFEVVSVGWILSALAPGIEGPLLYRVLGDDVHLGSLGVGLGTMALITLVNYRGAKSTATFQDMMTYGLLAISLVFITAGILGGDTQNLEPLFVRRSQGWTWMGILAVFATTPFWLSGFDVVPQAMGEKARGTVLSQMGKVIVLSLAVASTFYILVILAASMSMPREPLLALELPAAGAFEAAFDSPLLGKMVLTAGLLGIITTWNACFYAAARVVYALGRSHIIPPSYGSVHPSFRSPARAVLFVGLVGSVLGLLGRNALLPMVNAASASLAMVFFITCIGVIRLRRTRAHLERPYRVPGKKIIPIVAALASLAMTFLALYEPYMSSGGRLPVEWSFFIVWSILGLLFWKGAARLRNELSEDERRDRILS